MAATRLPLEANDTETKRLAQVVAIHDCWSRGIKAGHGSGPTGGSWRRSRAAAAVAAAAAIAVATTAVAIAAATFAPPASLGGVVNRQQRNTHQGKKQGNPKTKRAIHRTTSCERRQPNIEFPLLTRCLRQCLCQLDSEMSAQWVIDTTKIARSTSLPKDSANLRAIRETILHAQDEGLQ
jgi:hypothetical protein